MQIITTMAVSAPALTLTACNTSGSAANDAVATARKIKSPLAKNLVQCAFLPKNTTGEFELNALSDYLIEVRNLDGEVLSTSSEILLLGSAEEALYDLVVEDGLVLLKQVDQSAEVEVSDLEMTSFSGSCATYADGFYTTYGDLECDLQYLGDINLVQELAYEMVDIDGDYITKRYAQVYERVTSSVASLYGDVTLRLNVLTKSGEYIQGTPLNIAIR